MKICPKCNQQHTKIGIHCSIQCSNKNRPPRTPEQEAYRKKTAREGRMLMPLENKQAMLLNREASKVLAKLNKDFDTLTYDYKRKRVILEQDGCCGTCGIAEWCGKPLILELDHKDGNHENNIRANLIALCPNCHSQTPTWRGKTSGRKLNEIQRLLQYKRHAEQRNIVP